MPIRILIAEDQRIVREGLIALLEDESEVTIIGEASGGAEAVELFARLQPDVVLMDLQMPGVDGPEATRRIREQSPDARILVLTTYATDEFIFKALRAGARGYLLKGATVAEIARAIHAVARGERYLDSRIASRVAALAHAPRLSARERDVLRLVVEGKSNKEIATALKVTERTVKFHMTSIFNKLGAENRAQAASLAHQRGLV